MFNGDTFKHCHVFTLQAGSVITATTTSTQAALLRQDWLEHDTALTATHRSRSERHTRRSFRIAYLRQTLNVVSLNNALHSLLQPVLCKVNATVRSITNYANYLHVSPDHSLTVSRSRTFHHYSSASMASAYSRQGKGRKKHAIQCAKQLPVKLIADNMPLLTILILDNYQKDAYRF